MSTAKIAISIDDHLLDRVDTFIAKKKFKTRSEMINTAVSYILNKLEHNRLAQECAKLDPKNEQSLAEEGLPMDEAEWSNF